MKEEKLPAGNTDPEIIVSKSQRKKEMHALQALGEHLISIPLSLLEKCNLPAELRHAIDEYKRIPGKRGAQKRQLQFIGKLMRDVDIEPIEKVLAESNQQSALEKQRIHRLEEIREQLLSRDHTKSVLNELIASCSDLDIQYLRQLIRQAKKEKSTGKSPVAARKLFAYLREFPELLQS